MITSRPKICRCWRAYARAVVLERRAAEELAIAATVGEGAIAVAGRTYADGADAAAAHGAATDRPAQPGAEQQPAPCQAGIAAKLLRHDGVKGMRRVDQDALRRALEMAKAQSPGRREQIDAKLADEPWENVAAFAASCCQSRNLHLKPWECPPCDAGPTADGRDYEKLESDRHETAADRCRPVSLRAGSDRRPGRARGARLRADQC